MKLSRIMLYPIKSLDPLEVSEAEVTALGSLSHDREWALADAAGNFINAKRSDRLHCIRASFDPDCRTVTLSAPERAPQRFALADPLPIAAWFTDLWGQPVRLLRDSEQGFPDDLEANGPTLVSQASLEEVARWFQLDLEETRRRFRTNLEIEGAPPFWEDRLLPSPDTSEPPGFLIGKLNLEGINACQRCAVPGRDSHTGVSIGGFQKQFAEARKQSLPAWSNPSQFNHFYRFAVNTRIRPGQMGKRIRVGDPIVLPRLQA